MTGPIYYPVAELPDRYSISRQSVYDRLKFLNISTVKMEKKAHITAEQQELLDRLHQHLQSGVDMALFNPDTLPKKSVKSSQAITKAKTPTQPLSSQLSTERSPQSEDLTLINPNNIQSPVLYDLIQELAKAITSNQAISPISHHKDLDLASKEGWLLTSHEITALTGMKPKGDSFIWGCWQFIAKGKIGRSKGWIVEKIDV